VLDLKMDQFFPCPECGAQVVWMMSNCRVGAEARINCAKHHTQSRIEFIPDEDWFCPWTGVARREKNGDVLLYHPDGKTLLRKRY
jgi:hypothetical protein